MPLFQRTVIKKHLLELNNTEIDAAYKRFTDYFHNSTIQKNIREAKEEQFQEGFLRELFGHIMGFTLNPNPNFNLTTELKNTTNSKKADGAILIDGKAIAVIELKGTETTDLNKIEVQAFGYKNNQSECTYVITSNFEKLRFYIDNTIDYEEFNLFTLNREQFNLLYLCLSYENIKNNVPKRLKSESVSQEDQITKKLYKDYSEFKRALFNNLVELNPHYDKLLLFKKTQKLLDRFLFIFFAEDRLLLPTNLIFRINQEWKNLQAMRIPVSLYERYMVYFNDLNHGAKVTLPAFGKKTGEAITAEFEIFAYNGGLFLPDEVLDNVKIDDVVLHTYSEKLSHYDFDSDVDVNILGHIFENSLNEIDEIKSEIEGEVVDKTKTKRKKDGVFYTPKYITKYMVDNTVGKICEEKKAEIKLNDEDYINDKKLQTKTKKALLDKLGLYRNWLLDLTICDPACGSGAFLNQTLEFLIAEHRYIDELQAKLMGDAMILSDVETSILENNIYGVDLNDESVEIAKLSLWLRTAQKGRKLNSLNNNIKCGNSLIDDPAVAGDKAFSWEKEFPEVFAKGGFDVVIGNPPYVRIQNLDYKVIDWLKENKTTAHKRIDISTLFIEESFKFINDKGLISFITSNQFFKAEYGRLLRGFIKGHLLSNLDFSDVIVFDGLSTYVSILTFSRKEVEYVNYLKVIDPKAPIEENNFKKFDFNTLNTDTWDFSSNNALFEKIYNDCVLLGECADFVYGIITGNDASFIVEKETFGKLKIEKEVAFDFVKPENYSRYQLKYLDKYIIYPYDENNNIFAEDTFKNRFPNAYNYLLKNKLILENRMDSRCTIRDKGLDWYVIMRRVHPKDITAFKILFFDVGAQPNFYLDDLGFAFGGGTSHSLTVKNNIELDTVFLLSILNSKLLGWIINEICPVKMGGARKYGLDYMRKLPIKVIGKIVQENFIEQAKLMMSLNKELHLITEKFKLYFSKQFELEKCSIKLTKWYELEFVDFIKELNKAIKAVKGTSLTKKDEFEWLELFEENKKKALDHKAEIDNTDKEIDQMVYELYGLTEEEIKIVEG